MILMWIEIFDTIIEKLNFGRFDGDHGLTCVSIVNLNPF